VAACSERTGCPDDVAVCLAEPLSDLYQLYRNYIDYALLDRYIIRYTLTPMHYTLYSSCKRCKRKLQKVCRFPLLAKRIAYISE